MLILGVGRAHAGSQSPCSQRGKLSSCRRSWIRDVEAASCWKVEGKAGRQWGKVGGAVVHSVGGQTRELVYCAGGFSKNFTPFPLFIFFKNCLSLQLGFL